MSAEEIRGILKHPEAKHERVSKVTSFNDNSLMHTAHRPFRPEIKINYSPKPKPTINIDVLELEKELKKVWESEQYNFEIGTDEDSSEEEFVLLETLQERVHRVDFERRRKLHYTEFQTVQLARRLIDEEEFTWSEETIEGEHVAEFRTSSCEAEECSSDSAISAKSFDHLTAEQLSFEKNLESEPDTPIGLPPGESPSHPCFQKLTATKI